MKQVYLPRCSSSRCYLLILGLDTACITRTVVQNICSRWQQDTTLDATMTSAEAEITSDDMQKIKSIGWLVFDPSQRLDLLIESNTLIRAFLGKIQVTLIPYHFDAPSFCSSWKVLCSSRCL